MEENNEAMLVGIYNIDIIVNSPILTSSEEYSHPTKRTAQDTVAIAGSVSLISGVVRMEDSQIQNLLPASLLDIILDRARSFFAPKPLSSP
jgi:hypothetical protein